MEPSDALWHLANFVVLPLMVAGLATAAAKGLWRRELARVSWRRLAGWSAGAGLLVQAGGLLAFGRDGRMLTYLAMAAACALTLWWQGFGRGPGRSSAR